MQRRSLLVVVVLALVGSALGWLLLGIAPREIARADGAPGGTGGTAGAGPRRIVCAAPSVTELVCALGAEERVAAVTDWCTWPPELVAERPRIGGLYDPDRERILKLEPDLIAYAGDFDALRELGAAHDIPTLSLRMETLAGIRDSIARLGDLLGVPERAAAARRAFDAELELVRAKVAPYPPVPVYVCTEHRPGDLSHLGTVGATGFLGELVAVAGGANVFADVRGGWPQISKESLQKRAPAVIVELHPEGMGADPRLLDRLREDWDRLPGLPAVAAGRVHFLTEDYLLVPGVRAPRIARALAELLHPEAYW